MASWTQCWISHGSRRGDRNIPPRKNSPRKVPSRNIPPMKSMHGNVVWLCAKYAADANMFRLESSILTRTKRATNQNNVATEKRGGGGFSGGSIPRTILSAKLLFVSTSLKAWNYYWLQIRNNFYIFIHLADFKKNISNVISRIAISLIAKKWIK